MALMQHFPARRGKRVGDSRPPESPAGAPRLVLLAVNTDEKARRRLASMQVHPSNGTGRNPGSLRDVSDGRQENRGDCPDYQEEQATPTDAPRTIP